jgi:hypothetical protein
METKRIVADFDEEDMTVLEKVKELLRVKHGPVTNAFAIRTLLREYVAANEPKQEPK